MNDKLYTYKAKITNVVDGDTVDAQVDMGFSTFKNVRLRLKNIDTPEVRGVGGLEKEVGKLIECFVCDILENKDDIIIHTKKKGSFGRYLADIYIPELDDKTFNQYLLDRGFAKKYGSEQEWKSRELKKIEEELSYLKGVYADGGDREQRKLQQFYE